MIPLTKLNKHVRQIRLHPHENEENTESHCWRSTHVYSKSSSSGLNNCTVQHRKNILDWKEWETHSKQKARLSYSDAKQEPKWCTHECFHRSQGSNSSHLLWKPTHPASGHSFPWLTVILNTSKYHLQTKHGWFGWRIQFRVPVLYIQYQICEKGVTPQHKQMMWLNYLEQLSP